MLRPRLDLMALKGEIGPCNRETECYQGEE